MKKNYFLSIVLTLLCFTTSTQAYTINGFSASNWQASDATIGVVGYSIENFEDTTLISGLTYQVEPTQNPQLSPLQTSLPATINPSNDPINGGAFISGNWDGGNVFANSVNQTYTDYGCNNPTFGCNFHQVTFFFEGGADSIGFSIQQMSIDNVISVNGQALGGIHTLTPALTNGGGRNGYFRIDADNESETIFSFTIDNIGTNDGYALDHFAVQFNEASVPEPSFLLLSLAAFLTCLYIRK